MTNRSNDSSMIHELERLRAENQILRKGVVKYKKQLAELSTINHTGVSKVFLKNLTQEQQEGLNAVLFENLFNNDPDGVFLSDKQGYIVLTNKAFAEQLGMKEYEVEGVHLKEFLEDPLVFDSDLVKLRQASYLESTVRQKTKYGSAKTLERKAVLINLPGEEEFMVLVISRDISPRIEREKKDREVSEKLRNLNHELYTLNQLHEATLVELEESYEALEIAYSKLKDSEENYRIISENTGDFIFRVKITEGKPRFFYLGPAVRKLGYSPEVLKGTNPIDYLHPDDRKKTLHLVSKYYYQYKSSAKPSFDEDIYLPVRVISKSGKILHLECTLNISHEQIIIIAKDITELIHEMEVNEQQKQRLQKAEKSYRNIYNSASDVFLVLDENLYVLDANDSAEETFGYNRKELKTINLQNLLVSENRDDIIARARCINQSGKFLKTPEYVQAMTKTGKHIWMSVVFQKTEYNEARAVFAVLRDVDELKKAQDSLAESEQRFRMLAESGGSGIFIYQDDRFVYANKKVEQIVGYRLKKLRKMHFREIVHPDMKDGIDQEALWKLMKSDKEATLEMKLLTGDRSVKWINFTAKSIQYMGKGAAIGNIVDITDYKQTLTKWRVAKEKAEESDRLKSAFLSNMSHEIRTPMNGILGFSQLLDDDNLDKKARQHYISIIKGSSRQLLRIIDDILDVSKIEVGQMAVSKEWQLTDIILSELYEIFEQKIKDSSANIQFKKEIKDCGIKIYTDSVRLKQVLTNLLDNALKYTEQGSITMGCELRQNKVLFFVKDTGCGIDKELQKYIFTRFSRLKNDYVKSVRGTGLGLAISKGLVELLGGEIYFESDGKTGTDFYFTHPLE